MEIDTLNHKKQDRLLNEVIKLADDNNKTLGFLPEGAIREQAKKRLIIIAYDNEKLLGYILFRNVQKYNRITIVHLCVNPIYREKKVSEALINSLKNKFRQSHNGIFLSCRRDYEANKIWSKFGFIPMGERLGRGKDKKTLTKWWFDFGKPDLFNDLQNNIENKIITVIDSNIVIHIMDKNINNEEAKLSNELFSDWLSDDLDIYITDEMFVEIDRTTNKNERIERKQKLKNLFDNLSYDKIKSNEIFQKFKKESNKKLTNNYLSDLKQLANAIVSGADVFLTWNIKDFSSLKNKVKKEYNLDILTPLEIVLRIDELKNPQKHQAQRVYNYKIKKTSISERNINSIIKTFTNSSQQEKEAHLKDKILQIQQKNGEFEVLKLKDESMPIAFLAYKVFKSRLEVSIFRILPNPLSQNLTNYLIQYLLSFNTQIIQINDSKLAKTISVALKKANFYFDELKNQFIKFSLKGVLNKKEVENSIKGIVINKQISSFFTSKANYELEKSLQPVKISDLDLPCFIIPIRPTWAMNLFEEKLSRGRLFGGDENRFLNNENVYYRHGDNRVKARSRILWYLSDDKNYKGESKQLRAVSYVDEVFVDKPKVLFKQFEKLGIYSWNDIYKTAKYDINNKISAFRFSNTQLLTKPIEYKVLQELFKNYTKKELNLQSPIQIDEKLFTEIYKKGI